MSGPAPRADRFRLALAAVLALVLVGAIGVSVVVAAVRTSGSFTSRVSQIRGGDDPVQDQRDVVMSQARQFMLRINTYGPDLLDSSGQMPKYRDLIDEIITPKFKTSFEQGVVAAEATVKQLGVERVATVYSSGVASMDSDSASVLVAGSFVNATPSPSDPSTLIKDDPLPFRVEVKLIEDDGTWLVDDFAPVVDPNDEANSQGVPSTAPTTDPSIAPSTSPSSTKSPGSPSPSRTTGGSASSGSSGGGAGR